MHDPVVSVVVATRDRPALAARALASIHAQSFRPFEVIVVDDGSSPGSRAEYESLCEQYGDRFRLDCTVPPGAPGTGPAAVRNRGIRASRGRYVAFLDDDDEWVATDHLAVAVGALARTGGRFYFADVRGVRGDRVDAATWFGRPPERGGTPVPGEARRLFWLDVPSLSYIFRHHMIHPDCWVVDRRTLLALRGFNERLRFVEDLELGMRLADDACPAIYRAEVVAHYQFPAAGAESLRYDTVTILLQYVLAAATLRAVCGQPALRKCARARQAWALRQLASAMLDRRRHGAALSFCWQALATFPTAGAASGLLSVLARVLRPGRPAITERGGLAGSIQ